MAYATFGLGVTLVLFIVIAGLAVFGIIMSCVVPKKKGYKANVPLILLIAALAAYFIGYILVHRFLYMGMSGMRFPFGSFIIGLIISLIVPVFVIIARKARGVRVPFAIVSFAFAGIQLLFSVLYAIALRGGWSYSLLNVFGWFNGTGFVEDLIEIFRSFNLLVFFINFFYLISNALYIVKNIVGGIALLKDSSRTAAAPAYAPQGYAPVQPQYAPQAYAPAQPQYAPNGYVPAPAATVKNGRVIVNGVPYRPGFEPTAQPQYAPQAYAPAPQYQQPAAPAQPSAPSGDNTPGA